MMHKVTQAIEASGVMFSGQQGSLVQSVPTPMHKAIQAIEQVEVLFGGRQDN